MYNFLASCGLCSSNPTPGDYAYEAYTKIRTDLPNQTPQTSSDRRFQPQTQQLINTTPKRSIIAGDYTFKDLVNDNPREVYVRKIMKSSYAQLVKAHEESGRNFIDRQFPPEQSSIGDVEDLRVRATWKRIPDIIKDPLFVQGRIQPNDIFQGSLGDCYFLSAIAALAEKDYRIKNLFPELRLNKHGIYMARILYNGVLREVVVDDYIPVNQQGDPLFAKPAAGRQIWVMILEKCWAKLNGSYGAIVGGLPNEVLRSFSGAPTFYHEISEDKVQREDLWTTIYSAYQKGAVFCCGTKSQDRVQQYGLAKGHAYTLLKVCQNPYRMVKLRNPWGNREWQGRAAQRDWQFWSSIQPADRQALGFSQQNSKQGIFFMLWDDFINFYDMVDICHINDNASFSCCQELFSRKSAQMFEFETEGSNLNLTLSQDHQRSKKKRIFSRSIVIIGRQEEQADGISYKYITSSTSNLSSEHNLELNDLPKGKYVVYCKIRWIDSDAETASLSLYAGSPIHLASIKQSKHKQFLFQIFLDHARNNPKKQIIGQGQWICNDFLLRQCGYGYLAFHLDQTSHRKLGIEIAQSDYIEKRFVLKKPYKAKGSIKTSLSPGKELIVIFHIKSQNLPTSVTLPVPKIYNLV